MVLEFQQPGPIFVWGWLSSHGNLSNAFAGSLPTVELHQFAATQIFYAHPRRRTSKLPTFFDGSKPAPKEEEITSGDALLLKCP